MDDLFAVFKLGKPKKTFWAAIKQNLNSRTY
ncbi:MAG: hypothetical protein FD167_2442 [bacterium]|nr:MAG: hypothetical protein FD167_2442 [bacterium]